MTSALGDVNVAPGVQIGGKTTDIELLASGRGGYTQDGVTLAVGQGVLNVGTPLFRRSDGTYGKFVDSTATPANSLVGFLRHQVNTGVTGDIPKLAKRVYKGILKYSVIKAANGGTDLTSGQLTALGARVDTNRDYLIF